MLYCGYAFTLFPTSTGISPHCLRLRLHGRDRGTRQGFRHLILQPQSRPGFVQGSVGTVWRPRARRETDEGRNQNRDFTAAARSIRISGVRSHAVSGSIHRHAKRISRPGNATQRYTHYGHRTSGRFHHFPPGRNGLHLSHRQHRSSPGMGQNRAGSLYPALHRTYPDVGTLLVALLASVALLVNLASSAFRSKAKQCSGPSVPLTQ